MTMPATTKVLYFSPANQKATTCNDTPPPRVRRAAHLANALLLLLCRCEAVQAKEAQQGGREERQLRALLSPFEARRHAGCA